VEDRGSTTRGSTARDTAQVGPCRTDARHVTPSQKRQDYQAEEEEKDTTEHGNKDGGSKDGEDKDYEIEACC